VLHVLKIFAFVKICDFLIILFFPHTLAVFHAIFKNPTVSVAISPPILAVSFRSSVTVLTQINVFIRKNILALPMSQAVSPLALIFVSIHPLVTAIAVSFIFNPLADITVTSMTCPNPIAVLLTI
jgi:hypothetical protein